MHSHLLTTLAALAAPTFAFAQQELYLLDSARDIYRVDDFATAPTAVLVGSPVPPAPLVITDIAFDQVTAAFYATSSQGGGISGNRTLRIDPVTFDVTDLGSTNLAAYHSLDASADGRLFGYGRSFSELSAFETSDGSSTGLAAILPNSSEGDLAIDLDGALIADTQAGDFYRFDPRNGVGASLGLHGFGNTVRGLEFDTDGTFYVVLANGDIHTYDTNTATATFIGSTGIQVLGAAFTLPADSGIGNSFNYCGTLTIPNSTGLRGQIDLVGSPVAADNDFTLVGSNLPPNRFGIFYASDRPLYFNPGFDALGDSDGFACIQTSSPGFFRGPGQIQRIDASGRMSLSVDLTSLPPGSGAPAALAGERLFFQGWYRDSGVEGNNFTNGLIVIFE